MYDTDWAKPFAVEVVEAPSVGVVSASVFDTHLGDVEDEAPIKAAKLEAATQWVEGMTGVWWRPVKLRARASNVPNALALPFGRVDPIEPLLGYLVRFPNVSETASVKLEVDKYGEYAAVLLDGAIYGEDDRLEVVYKIDPGFVPAPVAEACMKLGTHLLDVRGASPKGEAAGSVGLGLSPSLASEITLMLKPFTRKLP